MLASPAANIAQHGSMNCALAGHGAVSTRTSASNEARSLCPNTQVRTVLSRSVILVMFPSFLVTGAATGSRAHRAAGSYYWRFLFEACFDVPAVPLPA